MTRKGYTKQAIEAAGNSLGYDIDEDRIEEAWGRLHNADAPLKELKKRLKDNVTVFDAQGGRGVELADEIDDLRIVIAVRQTQCE